MKQCAVCGAWNQPGDLYCQNCGELLPQERSDAKEPLFVRVKRACGSPVFLVAVVLYSVYTLVTIGMTIFEWIQNPNGTSVSYTHLDVYKRQENSCSAKYSVLP